MDKVKNKTRQQTLINLKNEMWRELGEAVISYINEVKKWRMGNISKQILDDYAMSVFKSEKYHLHVEFVRLTIQYFPLSKRMELNAEVFLLYVQ
ncbi:hypothetical protein A3Q56_07595 [Intoshia linei]|uniref:Uncharacterized protein n=1 Tax=Intoshia linei TaxID=1819745 RepID=A0A177ARQ4_9BILA|nr:hypothetical protein A3Q56_07595 [Intoshia linei]